MDKKNTMLLTVIAVATLLVAVVGATFAYFSVSQVADDFTDTTVDVEVEDVGMVTLSGGDTLSLEVSAEDMAKGNSPAQYHAENATGATTAKVATVTLDGGADNVVYNCRFSLTVTNTSTMSGLVSTDGGVNLTVDSIATITPNTGLVAGTLQSPENIQAGTYTVNFQMTGDADQAQTVDLITVGASVYNDAVDGTQADRLAGKTIGLGFSVSNFTCDTKALD